MPSFKEIDLQLHLTLNRTFICLHFPHMYIEIFISQKARFNQFIARYTFEKQLNGISFGFLAKGSIFNACHYMIMIFFFLQVPSLHFCILNIFLSLLVLSTFIICASPF